MNESRRICGNCDHPKEGHEFPRSEGGYGGGSSGACVVYSCGCRQFKSSETFREIEYGGPIVPKWFAEGVQVKIKNDPITKKYGLKAGSRSNEVAFAGEVGTLKKNYGIFSWSWRIQFSHGRDLPVRESELEYLRRAKTRGRYE